MFWEEYSKELGRDERAKVLKQQHEKTQAEIKRQSSNPNFYAEKLPMQSAQQAAAAQQPALAAQAAHKPHQAVEASWLKPLEASRSSQAGGKVCGISTMQVLMEVGILQAILSSGAHRRSQRIHMKHIRSRRIAAPQLTCGRS